MDPSRDKHSGGSGRASEVSELWGRIRRNSDISAPGKSPFSESGVDSRLPAYRRLYNLVRDAIMDGTLGPGERLPATRNLASMLGVSRNTVLGAFEQLLAEGYLHARGGAGTYVADLSEFASRVAPGGKIDEAPAESRGAVEGKTAGPDLSDLSRRGRRLAEIRVSRVKPFSNVRPFQPGVPAVDEVPLHEFTRLFGRYYRALEKDKFGYTGPQGYEPLREAIAGYLRIARGARCDANRVLIVNGSQAALDLCARMLLDPGDTAWMEEPGYLGARGALHGAGANLQGIPVDENGMRPDEHMRAAKKGKSPRLIYVTPSHQFPLGVTMSLERRLGLLEFAEREKSWILEDDYDSEYRYAGRPLSSLQGLDRGGRVIYIGTFSKVLFPAIRLGYLVVPERLVDAFRGARALVDRQSPLVQQAVLAHFMREGGFHTHIRRMRTLYGERRDVLLEELASSPLLTVAPCDTGMHTAVYLPNGSDDQAVSRAAAERGLDVPPLSEYYLGSSRPGLILGFSAFKPDAIRNGMKVLREVLQEFS